jgi:hypothetical protein
MQLGTMGMRARQLLDRSGPPVFGLETMQVVHEAFDRAWAVLEAACGSDPQVIDTRRLELAEAILAVTRDDSRDPEQIKLLALQLMQIKR